jgi:hypothetical protein
MPTDRRVVVLAAHATTPDRVRGVTEVPIWLQIVVAGGTILSAGAAFVSALSSAASKRAADTARDDAVDAWKKSAEALEKANHIQVEQYEAERGARDRERRGPFVDLLSEFWTAIIAARLAGSTDEQVLTETLEELRALSAAQRAANEPTSEKFARWVSTYARKVPLSAGDFEEWFAATQTLDRRVKKWLNDPTSAMAEIREDPMVDAGPIDPGDEGDFRVP